MSIMDIFRPGKVAEPQQQQATPANTSTTMANNATVPNGNAAPDMSDPAARNTAPADINKDGAKSPLDGFTELFKIDDSKTPANQDSINFNLDRTQLAESVKKIDIRSAINQELVTKALAGDAEALMQVMADVSHQTLLESTMANTAILDTALKANGRLNDNKLATRVRSIQAAETLQQNPQFNHPAVLPIVDSIRSSVQAKNPNASAAEIQQATADYFMAFVEHITSNDPSKKNPEPTAQETVAKAQDFSQW